MYNVIHAEPMMVVTQETIKSVIVTADGRTGPTGRPAGAKQSAAMAGYKTMMQVKSPAICAALDGICSEACAEMKAKGHTEKL